MNSFKTFLALAALAASGYAVYLSIYGPAKIPTGTAEQDGNGPDDGLVELDPSLEGSPPSTLPLTAEGGGAAPLFNSPSGMPPPAFSDDEGGPPSGDAFAGDFIGSLPANLPETPRSTPPAGSPGTVPLPTPLASGTVPSPPMVTERFGAAWSQAQEMLRRRELPQALRILSDYYDWDGQKQIPEADYQKLINLLDQLAGTVIYSQQAWVPDHAYVVQSGETLREIAQKHSVSWQLLAKINGLVSPNEVRPGDRIKVIRGPFDAVVDVKSLRMTLRVGGLYAGRFRIGAGQTPPDGEYMIRDKESNPVQVNYPLAARLLDLGDGYGIHGTSDPGLVGKAGAAGCVCLTTRDAEDVFDILSVGSPIMVIGSMGAAPSALADRSMPDRPAAPLPGPPGFTNSAPPFNAPPTTNTPPPTNPSPAGNLPQPMWGNPPPNAPPSGMPQPTWRQ
jgi:lipoprotein-anchoring transpeptidase ErfK/SrfK